MTHATPGPQFAGGTPGYQGQHRADQPRSFAPKGQTSDRLRATPELMELEKQPADRGENLGRYDGKLDITDRWYPRD